MCEVGSEGASWGSVVHDGKQGDDSPSLTAVVCGYRDCAGSKANRTCTSVVIDS